MTYSRKCENWLEAFKDWTLDRSEASGTFIEWTGLWILAAALRRRVYIPKKYLGSWTCYPYLYVIFVAPPGMRKTTTVGYGIDLLELIPTLASAPTLITGAALVDSIIKAEEHAVYLTLEELGDLFMKGGDEMFEFLTSMYDGKKKLTQKTMLRDVEAAEKPTLNLIAGTTPRWIAEKMPLSAVEGGFSSRVIWVYEDKPRKRQMYYTHVKKDFLEIGEKLAGDLIHIAKLEGEFSIEDDALQFMEAWYQGLDNDPKTARLKRYPGYINRKPVMVHKVAMLHAISRSDDLIIKIEDFKYAIAAMERTETNFPKVFQGVGKNEYALEMKDIVMFVKENKEVSQSHLHQFFQSVASPAKLAELVEGLLLAGDLKSKIDPEKNNERVFYCA